MLHNHLFFAIIYFKHLMHITNVFVSLHLFIYFNKFLNLPCIWLVVILMWVHFYSYSMSCIIWEVFYFVRISHCYSTRQIEVLKDVTKDELVSFFMEHRHANSRKLSIHVCHLFVSVIIYYFKKGPFEFLKGQWDDRKWSWMLKLLIVLTSTKWLYDPCRWLDSERKRRKPTEMINPVLPQRLRMQKYRRPHMGMCRSWSSSPPRLSSPKPPW